MLSLALHPLQNLPEDAEPFIHIGRVYAQRLNRLAENYPEDSAD